MTVSFPKILKQDHNVKSIDTGHWDPIDVKSGDIGEPGRPGESRKPGEPISNARFCIRKIWSFSETIYKPERDEGVCYRQWTIWARRKTTSDYS